MNYWIISDTHFGHKKLCDYAGRPHDFSRRIYHKLERLQHNETDVFIHLGDICIGKDNFWNSVICLDLIKCPKWLVRGNHDKKSTSWYLEAGWDFVADSFSLRIFGKNILFSHCPQSGDYDLNIHGHFHNSDHRRHEPELVALKNERQYLFVLEHHYGVKSLKGILKEYKQPAVAAAGKSGVSRGGPK